MNVIRFLRDPISYLQVQIRTCNVAPWFEELAEVQVRHDYAKPGHRYAWLLCVACGVHPSFANDVRDIVVSRWTESAAVLTAQEIRDAIDDVIDRDQNETIYGEHAIKSPVEPDDAHTD